MKNLKSILLFVLLGVALSAHAEKKPKMQTVYVFGFSASFTDSVAFLTDVMRLDSAVILPNGFLADRSLYSLQLENFVLENYRVQNSTNAVFFSTNKKTMDKKYNKVNHMYQRSENLALIFVGEDEFRFTPVDYVDPTIQYLETPLEATGVRRDGEGNVAVSSTKGGTQ